MVKTLLLRGSLLARCRARGGALWKAEVSICATLFNTFMKMRCRAEACKAFVTFVTMGLSSEAAPEGNARSADALMSTAKGTASAVEGAAPVA